MKDRNSTNSVKNRTFEFFITIIYLKMAANFMYATVHVILRHVVGKRLDFRFYHNGTTFINPEFYLNFISENSCNKVNCSS